MWVNAPKGGRSRILSFLFISLAGLSPLSQTKLFTSKLWVVYRTRQSKQCKFLILIFMCLNFTCCPRCHCQIFISEKSLDKYSSLKNIPLWKIFPFKKYPPPENINPWKHSPLKIFTPENIHPWKYSPLKNIHQGKGGLRIEDPCPQCPWPPYPVDQSLVSDLHRRFFKG